MAQDNKIKIRRGVNASLPAGATEAGELRYSTDSKELYIDDGVANVKIGGDPAGFPVSTATQTALDLKANLASPTFTGVVTLPAGQVVNGVTLKTDQTASKWLDGTGAYTTVTATAPDIALNLLAPSVDETITAGYSAYVSDYYEIADTKFLEIGDGAVFEIG
jgi:hypothetical protein